jgi:ATP-binding cassette, subfamily B (MDR/TAP), member 1
MYISRNLIHSKSQIFFHLLQRVVVLKDQANKKAHEESAQLACEAAGAIRTVASLTRENDCCDLYGKSLEEPLQKSNRSAIWSNLLYSLSQSMMFFVISLIFWYGSRLVSFRQYSTFQFFIGLMVSRKSPGCAWHMI